MKKILLACFLLSASVTIASAQNGAPQTATSSVETSRLFSSKIIEWSASVTRNRPEISQKLFSDLAGMMQTKILENNRAMAGGKSEAEKQSLKSTIKTQQDLYTDIKMLSIDMAKNEGEMKVKLKSFLSTF